MTMTTLMAMLVIRIQSKHGKYKNRHENTIKSSNL